MRKVITIVAILAVGHFLGHPAWELTMGLAGFVVGMWALISAGEDRKEVQR